MILMMCRRKKHNYLQNNDNPDNRWMQVENTKEFINKKISKCNYQNSYRVVLTEINQNNMIIFILPLSHRYHYPTSSVDTIDV